MKVLPDHALSTYALKLREAELLIAEQANEISRLRAAVAQPKPADLERQRLHNESVLAAVSEERAAIAREIAWIEEANEILEVTNTRLIDERIALDRAVSEFEAGHQRPPLEERSRHAETQTERALLDDLVGQAALEKVAERAHANEALIQTHGAAWVASVSEMLRVEASSVLCLLGATLQVGVGRTAREDGTLGVPPPLREGLAFTWRNLLRAEIVRSLAPLRACITRLPGALGIPPGEAPLGEEVEAPSLEMHGGVLGEDGHGGAAAAEDQGGAVVGGAVVAMVDSRPVAATEALDTAPSEDDYCEDHGDEFAFCESGVSSVPPHDVIVCRGRAHPAAHKAAQPAAQQHNQHRRPDAPHHHHPPPQRPSTAESQRHTQPHPPHYPPHFAREVAVATHVLTTTHADAAAAAAAAAAALPSWMVREAHGGEVNLSMHTLGAGPLPSWLLGASHPDAPHPAPSPRTRPSRAISSARCNLEPSRAISSARCNLDPSRSISSARCNLQTGSQPPLVRPHTAAGSVRGGATAKVQADGAFSGRKDERLRIFTAVDKDVAREIAAMRQLMRRQEELLPMLDGRRHRRPGSARVAGAPAGGGLFDD